MSSRIENTLDEIRNERTRLGALDRLFAGIQNAISAEMLGEQAQLQAKVQAVFGIYHEAVALIDEALNVARHKAPEPKVASAKKKSRSKPVKVKKQKRR